MTDAADHLDHAFRDLLGFDTEQHDDGGRAWIDIEDAHLNPNGVVHGAVPYALVDTAMGAATMAVIAEGAFCATIEIQIRYFKPVSAGRLEAIATVRRQGKRIVHLDASVRTGDGVEVAAATGSYAIIVP